MKSLLLLLLTCFCASAAIVQTTATTNTSPVAIRAWLGVDPANHNLDFGNNKGTNAADPTDPQDLATFHWATNWVATHGSSSDWSTHVATSDVDFDHFNILNGGVFVANNLTANGTVYQQDEIDSSSGGSFISLFANPSFGIYNGEPAGVGSDINLVAQNGNVVVGNSGITGVEGTLPFSDGDGQAVDLISSISHGRIWSGNVSGPRGVIDITPEFDTTPEVGLRVAVYDGLFEGGTDVGTCFMQCSPASTGYGVLEAPAGLGMILGTGNGATPVIFAINRVEAGRFDSGSRFLVGATSDDGTGALIQSAGDISAAVGYWAGGSQGASGTMADGSTVIGGLITHIGP